MSAQTVGVAELIGLVGRAATELNPEGRVFVRGEYWNARSDEEVPAHTRVEVTAVEGLRLRVRRAREI
jgi:membrane-bound serine protease (ClpP class)